MASEQFFQEVSGELNSAHQKNIEQIKVFFDEMNSQLDSVRRSSIRQTNTFFAGLKPLFDTAQQEEREINRRSAYQFNVFECLRIGELGLSRIIADLLNPNSQHGQGTQFLRLLISNLTTTKHWCGLLCLEKAEVSLEFSIENQKRIDVYAQIPSSNESGDYCLAIENKPYSGDRENQIKDYLEHLSMKFHKRFVLIYLSPNGKPPSEKSLGGTNILEFGNQFANMVYDDATLAGNIERSCSIDYSLNFQCEEFTITDWLKLCRDECVADRVKWFLDETRVFCQREFGNRTMSTRKEIEAIRNYVWEKPEHLSVAQTVYDSWHSIKHDICDKFLLQLRDKILEESWKQIAHREHEITVDCFYEGESKNSNCIILYRKSWKQIDNEGSTVSVKMENDSVGPMSWFYGVYIPIMENERRKSVKTYVNLVRNAAEESIPLREHEEYYPCWEYFQDEQSKDWNDSLIDILNECKNGGGRITDFITKQMIDTAVKFFPILDEIERSLS